MGPWPAGARGRNGRPSVRPGVIPPRGGPRRLRPFEMPSNEQFGWIPVDQQPETSHPTGHRKPAGIGPDPRAPASREPPGGWLRPCPGDHRGSNWNRSHCPQSEAPFLATCSFSWAEPVGATTHGRDLALAECDRGKARRPQAVQSPRRGLAGVQPDVSAEFPRGHSTMLSPGTHAPRPAAAGGSHSPPGSVPDCQVSAEGRTGRGSRHRPFGGPEAFGVPTPFRHMGRTRSHPVTCPLRGARARRVAYQSAQPAARWACSTWRGSTGARVSEAR